MRRPYNGDDNDMNLQIEPDNLIHQLVRKHLGTTAAEISRFPTGLTHYVYDVRLSDGKHIVVRLAVGDNRQEFKNGLYWQTHLEDVRVILPKIYAHGQVDEIDFALIERLPGEDIELVYQNLSTADKQNIAAELISFQAKVSRLDLDLFKRIFENPRPNSEMIGIVLRRCENGFKRLGLFNLNLIAQLGEAFNKIRPELDQLPLIPYLYDTSVKNVIVDRGKISGFIDVDEVWLGDPLLAVGRCNALSLCRGWDTILADSWVQQLNLTKNETHRIDLYTALYCLRTMSILGGQYNGTIQMENDLSRATEIEMITNNYFRHIGLMV